MTSVALYNLKGGVGKTAGVINLAHLAAQEGYRVLVWDLDPQAAASFYLQSEASSEKNTKKLLAGDLSIEDLIQTTNYDNLDIIPADFSSRKLDVFIDQQKGAKKVIKQLLKPMKSSYDLVFIDCPPGFSLLAENIFQASDVILLPTIPSTLSLRTFETVQEYFDENKIDRSKMMGYFSMVDSRKTLHTSVMESFADQRRFFESFIPYLSEVEKMGIHQAPLTAFAPNSRGAQAFVNLWKEISEGIF